MTTRLEILTFTLFLGITLGWSAHMFLFKNYMPKQECALAISAIREQLKARGITKGPASVCMDFKEVP